MQTVTTVMYGTLLGKEIYNRMIFGLPLIFLFLMVKNTLVHGQDINADICSDHGNTSMTCHEWSAFVKNCSKYVNT